MTYRLAFIRTIDGYLKVTAFAKGVAPLTTIHLNPDVWGAAARVAALSDDQLSELNVATQRAWAKQLIDVCCEAVELQPDQLKCLGFIEDWQKVN